MAYFQEISPGIIIKQKQTFVSPLGPVGSVSLLDNQISPVVLLTYSVTDVQFLGISYSLKRSTTDYRKGFLNVTHDTLVASITDEFAAVGDPGVVFSADISGGFLRILYTTTSTGFNATMKYNDLERWI